MAGRGGVRRFAAVISTASALVVAASPGPARGEGLLANVGSYEVEVLVAGSPAMSYEHAGATHVLGQPGERYTLRVWNRTTTRIEAVVTIDGRDVSDGKPSDFRNKRGYLVNPGSSVEIDGWRLPSGQTTAFRFTSVASAYAARGRGARNIGVVAVAVFPERVPRAQVAFVRAAEAPVVNLGLRYSDRHGLRALGLDLDGPSYSADDDVWNRGNSDPFRGLHRRPVPPPAPGRR